MPETNTKTPDIRDLARKNAQLGIAYLARAFNHCDDAEVPYYWPKATREEFERLAVVIVGLVERDAICPRAGALAQDDRTFQKFLRSIT